MISRAVLSVAGLLILLAVCGLRPASAQNTQSQRRLSPSEGPQGPIEQLRLLMHFQQLQSQLQSRDAAKKRSDKQSLTEKLRSGRGILKNKNVTPDNTFPTPQENTPRGSTKTQNDLQRLQEQLGQLLPDAAPPAADSSSQREAPSASETEKFNRNQSQNRTKDGSSNRSRSPRAETPSQRPAHGGESFQPDSDLLREIAKNYPDLLNSPGFVKRMMDLQQRQSSERSNSTEKSKAEKPEAAFDISKELSRSGLTKTVTQLVRDIQAKVHTEHGTKSESGDGSTQENSSLNQTLFRMLDTAREVVIETVRKSREDQKDRTAGRRPESDGAENNRGHSADQHENSTSLSTSTPTQESPPSPTSTERSPFTPLNNLSDWGSSLNNNTSTQLFVILFGLGAAAAMYFLITRRKLRARSQSHTPGLTAVRPENIHTREDIIRAFHWLTHCQSPDAADWWNHLQAAESLSRHSAGRDESLRQLLSLYEAARYQPADHELDQTHIQQARNALSECLS